MQIKVRSFTPYSDYFCGKFVINDGRLVRTQRTGILTRTRRSALGRGLTILVAPMIMFGLSMNSLLGGFWHKSFIRILEKKRFGAKLSI